VAGRSEDSYTNAGTLNLAVLDRCTSRACGQSNWNPDIQVGPHQWGGRGATCLESTRNCKNVLDLTFDCATIDEGY
jgi:hypothetical protein